MSLINRIDIALQRAGKTRSNLAEALGMTAQSITNLQRRPGSTMRCENVARAARYLHADVYWLCTGEGGEYVPEVSEPEYSLLARDMAQWLDAMSDADRWKAFGMLYQMSRGHWPVFPVEPPPRDSSAPVFAPSPSRP